MNSADISANSTIGHVKYDNEQVLGLELQFSKMLGDVIVENYLKSISEEDMKLIIDHMTSDLFEEIKDWNGNKVKRVKDNWKEDKGYYNSNTVISVGNKIKEMFNQKVKEELKLKIEEIIKSTEYQEKIVMMAQDIVDYSIEGYKEDLKQSIREKMIGNVMGNSQYYGGTNLIDVINMVIDNRLPRC